MALPSFDHPIPWLPQPLASPLQPQDMLSTAVPANGQHMAGLSHAILKHFSPAKGQPSPLPFQSLASPDYGHFSP
jgi:hypothetical protein